jgi:hypothetical protein
MGRARLVLPRCAKYRTEIMRPRAAHFSQFVLPGWRRCAALNSKNGETALNHSKQSLGSSLAASRPRSFAFGAALLTSLALSPSPAQAAVPGLTLVSNSTPWTSDDKSVSVTCPFGAVPLSAGFQTGGTMRQGRINVTGAYPTATNSILVSAEESLAGFSSNWNLSAYAVCANTPPGYQVVSATVNAGSASSVGTTASCPGNKVLLGTGMKIQQAARQVLLTALEPTTDSVYVEAQEDILGTTSLWSLTGYAFCADPLPTHGVYETVSALSSANSKTSRRTCPGGTEILGVGGWIENPTNNGDVSLFNLYPVIYSGNHTVFSDADETPGSMSATTTWALHSHVICGSY